MKKKAEREVVCTLCGKTFSTTCPTVKHCQECRAFINCPGPRNHEHYINPTWQAWKDKIYGIVERQKRRAEEARKKGGA